MGERKSTRDRFIELQNRIGLWPARIQVNRELKEEFLTDCLELLIKEGGFSEEKIYEYKNLIKTWEE